MTAGAAAIRGRPTDAILKHVRALATDKRAADRLVAMLLEDAPIYAGRRTDEVEQLRAAILGAFARHELPAQALPFVLEELESGGNPQTVAAAAAALRSARQVPSQAAALLIRAVDRFANADDCVDASHPDGEQPTTLLSELLRTLAWLGPRAAEVRGALQAVADRHARSFSDTVRSEMGRALASLAPARSAEACCCHPETVATGGTPAGVVPPSDLVLQDQDGELTTFGAFFGGRPGVVTFFYTRCMVPEKCSLTITKLARLQHSIASRGLRDRISVAAITYDPEFDLPPRLRADGIDRGMTFDGRNRLLRAPQGIDPLRRYFDLHVGFGAVTVNRHRLELFVLGKDAQIDASFTRMQWDEEKILAALPSS